MSSYGGCPAANLVVQEPLGDRWFREKISGGLVPGVPTSTSPCWHMQGMCAHVCACERTANMLVSGSVWREPNIWAVSTAAWWRLVDIESKWLLSLTVISLLFEVWDLHRCCKFQGWKGNYLKFILLNIGLAHLVELNTTFRELSISIWALQLSLACWQQGGAFKCSRTCHSGEQLEWIIWAASQLRVSLLGSAQFEPEAAAHSLCCLKMVATF